MRSHSGLLGWRLGLKEFKDRFSRSWVLSLGFEEFGGFQSSGLEEKLHIHYYYGVRLPKTHNKDGLLGPNSIMVVYWEPLGGLSNPG